MSALASICFSTGSASRSRPHKLPPQFHAATISVWLLLLSLADRRRFSSCFYSPPESGGVAAPSKNAAKPPWNGADGVVPNGNHPASPLKYSGSAPLLTWGTNILDSSWTETKRDFEIGRILHLKSEIRNLQLDWRSFQSRAVQSEILDLGFEMQDSSNFKIFSKGECVAHAKCRHDPIFLLSFKSCVHARQR